MLPSFRFVFIRLFLFATLILACADSVWGQGEANENNIDSLQKLVDKIYNKYSDSVPLNDLWRIFIKKRTRALIIPKNIEGTGGKLHGIDLSNLKLPNGKISFYNAKLFHLSFHEIKSKHPVHISNCKINRLSIWPGTLFAYDTISYNPRLENGFKCVSSYINDLSLIYTFVNKQDIKVNGSNRHQNYHFIHDTIESLTLNCLEPSIDTAKNLIFTTFDACHIQTIVFEICSKNFNRNVYFTPSTSIDTVHLRNAPESAFDISHFIPNASASKPRIISFYSTFPDSIRLNYRYYKLNPKSVDNYHKKDPDVVHKIYQNLMSVQEENGYKEGKQKLDIEYNDFLLRHEWSFDRFFSKHWWNYGYNKELIFKWTLGLFCLFFFTNLFTLKYLYYKIYPMKPLHSHFEQNYTDDSWVQKTFYHIGGTFFYSALIFFGIRLEVSNFNINRTIKDYIAATYLYSFYVIGIICLVFIANYVLLK